MRTILLTMALVFCAASAQAQLIVGNDQTGTATIYHVDVTTGVATPIYAATTAMAKPWGMAYDATTNTLYWNNGSTLYSSPYSLAGLTPVSLGTMMFNASTINFVGLGFRDGRLLGSRNIATEAIYEINPGTLQATQVYVYPSAFDFGGLDVDATTGILYGLSDAAPAGSVRGLYEINTVAQSWTFRAAYPAGETDIDGLAVNNGRAYYVTDGPASTQQYFYVYDIASGTLLGTLPSPLTGSGTFCEGAWVGGGVTETKPTTWGNIKEQYR